MGKQGERQPRTEWAGMTDWVQTEVKPRTEIKKGEGRSKEGRGDGQRPSEPE